MEFVKCPQCNGCKDHTANHECRKTCFAYKIAAARQQNQRQQIKKAQAADKLYDAYEAAAVERMKQRDWRYSRRKRRLES